MCRLFVLLVAVPLVIAGLALPASAQPTFRHAFSFGYWVVGNATASEDPGPVTTSWSTSIWNLDYRARSLTSPWGVHLHYASGARETFWSAALSFGVPISTPGLDLRAFLGYGSLSVTPTTGRWSSTGFRVGVEAEYPLARTAPGLNANLAFNVMWHPSNTVTSPTGATTRGTIFEAMVAAEFKLPWTGTMPRGQADYYLTSLTTLHDPNWAARVGIKTLGATGSSFQWTGPFFELSKTF